MPTYRITDQTTGKVYRVTGDGTPEEALAQFQAQMGGQAPAPATPVEAPKQSGLEELLQGLKASLDSTALGLKGLLPQSVQDFGDSVDKSMGSGGLTKATAVQAPDSVLGTTGKVVGDIGTALIPGTTALRAAQAAKLGLTLRALQAGKTGAGMLPAAAALGTDIAANAGISAAMAPEDRGTAALFGAGGSALGAAGTRVLGGALRNSVSPEAKLLMDNNIQLTPGQALSGPQAGLVARGIRNTEDKLTSMPIIGDIIGNAQNKSVDSFNAQQINQALEIIGKKVQRGGLSSIEEAEDLISNEYDRVLPHITLEPNKANVAVLNAMQDFKNIPFFNDTHLAKVSNFIESQIDPMMQKGSMSGKDFKLLDSQLGELGRKLGSKGGTLEGPLGEAMLMLRDSIRQQLTGATPEATKQLDKVNEAFAKLVPVVKAGKHRSSGMFTPLQISNAIEKSKGSPDALISAARQVLPSGVPDTGTAGREVLSRILTPAGLGAGTATAAGLSGLAPLAYAAAGIGAMYTKPGMRGLTEGVHPLAAMLRKKMSTGPYNPEQTEFIIQNLLSRSFAAPGQE